MDVIVAGLTDAPENYDLAVVEKAANDIRKAGHRVLWTVPRRECEGRLGPLRTAAVKIATEKVDAVVLVPNWHWSTGSSGLAALARAVGVHVFPLARFLNGDFEGACDD